MSEALKGIRVLVVEDDDEGFQVRMPKPFEPSRLICVISELAVKYGNAS